jgi:hypothetical protein
MYKRYYDIDVDAKAYANNIVKAGGVIPLNINQISDFIKNQKNKNLWSNLVDAWFFRGVHNIGKGSTVFSLRNAIKGTLNGGLSYGSDSYSGLTMSRTLGRYISTNYNLESEFTIEIVYYISDFNAWSTLWGTDLWNNSQGYLATFTASTTLNIGASNAGTRYNVTTNAVKPITRYSITQGSNTSTCYINGAQAGTSTISNYRLSNVGLFFGSRHINDGTAGSGNDIANGNIFAALVYNKALNANEILNNYNNTKGRIDV